MTDSIKDVALQRAMRMLDAAGARYCVITEDGRTFGELKVADTPKRSTPKRDLTERFDYVNKVKQLSAGGWLEFKGSRDDMARLRACVASLACTHFGRGSTITRVQEVNDTDAVLQVLVVEDQRHAHGATAH